MRVGIKKNRRKEGRMEGEEGGKAGMKIRTMRGRKKRVKEGMRQG